MKQLLNYRTPLLAQTGICSEILPECIEEYITSVTGFINKCIEDVVPTVAVRTYPNQKPWITGNIRTELKDRAAAFKEWDTNPGAYKKSHYAIRLRSDVAGLAKYYRLQREAQPRAAQ
jgi:hypothetical protein